MLFTFVEGHVITYTSQGIYKQARLAARGGRLYAALNANAFIMLHATGITSNPNTRWSWLEDEAKFPPDSLGRLTVPERQT